MGRQPEFEENCERYLLGELSAAEAERFEEAYFADDALFKRVQAVKEEMLDAYARGELAEEKQKRFAAHFLVSGANRHQLEETRKFIRAVTAVSAKTASNDGAAAFARVPAKRPAPSRRKSFGVFFNLRPFARQVTFAAALLAALAGVWLLVRNLRQAPGDYEAAGRPTPLPMIALPSIENQSAAIPANNNAAPPTTGPTPGRANKPPANANQTPADLKSTPPPKPKKPTDRPIQNRQTERAIIPSTSNSRKDTPFVLTLSTVGRDPGKTSSISLSPVASRDINDENTLEIYRTTRRVRARLVFKNDDYRSFSAAVATVEGATVWQKKGLKADLENGETKVVLRFPSALLTKQDYLVTLTGITAKGQTETVGEYYFRVERSPN